MELVQDRGGVAKSPCDHVIFVLRVADIRFFVIAERMGPGFEGSGDLGGLGFMV